MTSKYNQFKQYVSKHVKLAADAGTQFEPPQVELKDSRDIGTQFESPQVELKTTQIDFPEVAHLATTKYLRNLVTQHTKKIADECGLIYSEVTGSGSSLSEDLSLRRQMSEHFKSYLNKGARQKVVGEFISQLQELGYTNEQAEVLQHTHNHLINELAKRSKSTLKSAK